MKTEKEKKLMKIAMKALTEKELMKIAKTCEKENYSHSAAVVYAKAYIKYGTKEAYRKALNYAAKADREGLIHRAEDIYSRLGIRPAPTLDNIVKAIMLFSGAGLLFYFFSKPKAISGPAQAVQLAPPLPNYMIYVFGLLLIAGIVYFLVKAAFKRRDIIPLSFA